MEQRRLDSVQFDAGIFTNLSFEHLNYHKTMENYYHSKVYLFQNLLKRDGVAIINSDDEYGKKLISLCTRNKQPLITFGVKKGDIRLESYHIDKDHSDIKVSVNGIFYKFSVPVTVKYQLLNMLPVIAYHLGQHVSMDKIIETLSCINQIPGRFEKVTTLPNNASVYLDFAHKPAALESLLQSLHAQKNTGSNLSIVFGCDGNADHDKQPIMGNIAHQYCDIVYVTDDNPRKSDPNMIRKKIIGKNKNYIEIPNRKYAIQTAIKNLKHNDICVIIAKLAVFDDKIPGSRPKFGSDERQIIYNAVLELGLEKNQWNSVSM